jgi:DNA-binding MarR family transcriptional regulator
MTDTSSPAEDGADRIQRAWQRERPGTPVNSIGIITRIWRVAKLLDDERRRTDVRLGLDASTRDLLSTLRRAGPPYQLPPGEIARQALVSAGAISQRIRRAEDHGLVHRDKGGTDGRSVVVTLTELGHQLIEERVDELLAHEDTLLNSLDHDQRQQLSGLLRIVLADLTERFGTEDRP